MGGIALEFKIIDHIRHHLITDGAVQFSRDSDSRKASHAIQTEIITAGQVSEHFRSKTDAGGLDGVDQGAGRQKVMGEAFRFLIPDVFRKIADMAQDDVAEFTGQGTMKNKNGQALIIGDKILRLAVFHIDSGERVLVFFMEKGNDAAAILVELI